MSTGHGRRLALDVRASMIARRLGSLAPLNDTEVTLLNRVGAGQATVHPVKAILAGHGGDHQALRYILSGWAAVVRELKDGRRQLIQLQLPGDCIPSSDVIRHDGHVVHGLTIVQVVDGSAVRMAARDASRHPGIAAAVERAAQQERSFLNMQITRLGRQNAHERMAHLFMELLYRFRLVGMAEDNRIPFPLTQEAIADLLGLSVVHVNRTLQVLRRDNQVSLRQGYLEIHDVPALQELSEFREPVWPDAT